MAERRIFGAIFLTAVAAETEAAMQRLLHPGVEYFVQYDCVEQIYRLWVREQ